MMKIELFEQVSSQYKIIVFDAYGVLKKEGGAIPGAKERIEVLSLEKKPFYLLTNDSSISPERISKGYQNYGIPQMTEDRIVSSGMSTQNHIKSTLQPNSKVVYVGQEYSKYYVEEAGMDPVSISDYDKSRDANVAALVFLDHTSFRDFSNINRIVNLLRDNPTLPVFVANTDLVYPVSDDEFSVAVGIYSVMFEAITERTFEKFAKPSSFIFQTLFDRIQATYPYVKKDEILMVGDTLDTDILGGNSFGFSTCLVLSGATKEEQAQEKIAEKKIKPTHVCYSVAE